eukprot:gene13198-27914_t
MFIISTPRAPASKANSPLASNLIETFQSKPYQSSDPDFEAWDVSYLITESSMIGNISTDTYIGAHYLTAISDPDFETWDVSYLITENSMIGNISTDTYIGAHYLTAISAICSPKPYQSSDPDFETWDVSYLITESSMIGNISNDTYIGAHWVRYLEVKGIAKPLIISTYGVQKIWRRYRYCSLYISSLNIQIMATFPDLKSKSNGSATLG